MKFYRNMFLAVVTLFMSLSVLYAAVANAEQLAKVETSRNHLRLS